MSTKNLDISKNHIVKKKVSRQMILTEPKKKVFNLGFTQADLVRITGLKTQEVSETLNGDRFVPAFQKAIARAVDKDEEWLFGKWHWSKQKRKTRVKKKK